MKEKFTAIAILIVCFGLLCGCHHSPQKSKQTSFFEWTDSYHRTVTLDREPARIVSLSPSITEVIYMLGAQDKLVGVSDFCNYPPEVSKIEKMGGMQNLNIEAIMATRPNVVLIGSIVSKKDVATIEKMKIPVIAIKEESSLQDMAELISIVGRIVNREAQAKMEVQKWMEEINTLQAMNGTTQPRKRVYYVVGFGDSGDFTAPKGSHIHEIIELAGCQNIGETLKSWNISREFLFQSDPDIILIRKEDKEAFCSQYPYTLLKAVQKNQVLPIESGWIDVVSPRNLQAVKCLHEMAYPGLF